MTARLVIGTDEQTLRDAGAHGPFAVLAVGDAVPVTTRLLPVLRTPHPVTRLFVARAAPAPGAPVPAPVGVLCGAHDPDAPPRLMSGWRARSGEGFAAQVFDAGADFLASRAGQVVHGIVEDLRIQPAQVPGRGFTAIGGGPW